jgi:nicotinate-nucleotide adenylyltransferase
MNKKTGLFFGSFNPVHNAHLQIAEYMAWKTDLDEIWFVLTCESPHKINKDLLDFNKRLELIKKAIKGNMKLKVTDCEYYLPIPNYTADTLRYLRCKYKTYNFAVIMGYDNIKLFPFWIGSKEILENHEIYVYPRGDMKDIDDYKNPKIKIFKFPLLKVSSTQIRNNVKNNISVSDFMPDNINKIIEDEKIFLN